MLIICCPVEMQQCSAWPHAQVAIEDESGALEWASAVVVSVRAPEARGTGICCYGEALAWESCVSRREFNTKVTISKLPRGVRRPTGKRVCDASAAATRSRVADRRAMGSDRLITNLLAVMRSVAFGHRIYDQPLLLGVFVDDARRSSVARTSRASR